VNLWMKRAIGAAALGGGLLALGAGAASAQELSADASARVGRPTSAQVRVCADGRVLSRLLGGCSGQSGTSATVRAGDGIRARVRASRLASADASVGARPSRPAASAQASAATADTSPQASADADASLSRPRAGRLLRLRPVASAAGVGLLGTSPFTLVGDPASGDLLQLGDLTLGDLAGEAPAGIGVLDSGPIASGNQVDVDAGDVSPSAPVTVCGNGVGALGDATASCPASQSSAGSSAPAGNAAAGSGSTSQDNPSSDSLLDGLASGNQVDAGIGSVSPSVPVTVCGNAVGDASVSCAADTSTGGTIAPPPGTTTPGSTDTDGTQGSPGSTGTSGIPGTTTGLTPGTSGAAGDPANSFAPLRSALAGADTLAFTGAAADLLAAVATGLLAAGALIVRAAGPATAATEGGEDR
jgi:hypothetical protein